jgi:CelD/BcsL family acetyltransferase involved in cellulose biosynthesis
MEIINAEIHKMNIRIINSEKEFAGLEQTWNALLEKSGANHIQLTHQWLYTWWKHFHGQSSLFILIAEEDGAIAGIAPLMIMPQGRLIRNSLKRKVLTFIGLGFTDFSDIIIERKNEIKVLNEMMKFIMSNDDKWDEVDLRQINTTSSNYCIYSDIVKQYDEFDINLNFIINTPRLHISGDYETYYSGLASMFRKQIGRYTRKLKSEGDLKFEVADEITDNDLSEIFELNRKRNQMTNRRSIFLQEEKMAFIRDITNHFNNKKWMKLFSLRFNGRMICYNFTFDYTHGIFDWNTSYDLDYEKYSVGRLLNNEIIKYCFENQYTIYDLMAGDEEYKLKWTKTIEKNYSFTMQKKNFTTLFLKKYNKVKYLIRGEQCLPN